MPKSKAENDAEYRLFLSMLHNKNVVIKCLLLEYKLSYPDSLKSILFKMVNNKQILLSGLFNCSIFK